MLSFNGESWEFVDNAVGIMTEAGQTGVQQYPDTDKEWTLVYSNGNIVDIQNLPIICTNIAAPTRDPTKKPTDMPTYSPSKRPTASPSEDPTTQPTDKPTKSPSKSPTKKPTDIPTIISQP
jgi:hypothetical protein